MCVLPTVLVADVASEVVTAFVRFGGREAAVYLARQRNR